MSTDQNITPAIPKPPRPRVAPEAPSATPAPLPAAAAAGVAWGHSAPPALAGFATTMFKALAEVCEFTYGREILPVGHLAKPEH